MRMAKSEEWQQREAWRASGKSAAEFCSGEAYTAKSLRWWAWHFGDQERKKASARATKPRFARVIAKRGVAKRTTDVPVVVHLAGARVEIGAGAERAVVSMVFETLRSSSVGDRA